jgi:membrane protease YdiL (CAAX protease family)
MKKNLPGFTLWHTILVFGSAALLLYLETHFLIPALSRYTGIEPVLFWFIVAGLGLFLPLLLVAFLILKSEGVSCGQGVWNSRMRFRKWKTADGLWTLAGVIGIGILSLGIMKTLEAYFGTVRHQPSFMYFEPLTPDRYWILMVWALYWPLNIMGEEILWRGVILPRQEVTFGHYAWFINGCFWSIFHIAFGWQLFLTMLPILFILPFIVQKTENSWTGVIIHAIINGPSFIAISFGLL